VITEKRPRMHLNQLPCSLLRTQIWALVRKVKTLTYYILGHWWQGFCRFYEGTFKGIVHPKMKILSAITPPQTTYPDITNLDSLASPLSPASPCLTSSVFFLAAIYLHNCKKNHSDHRLHTALQSIIVHITYLHSVTAHCCQWTPVNFIYHLLSLLP